MKTIKKYFEHRLNPSENDFRILYWIERGRVPKIMMSSMNGDIKRPIVQTGKIFISKTYIKINY